jgi:demethylmenaquinone methyltransferase/2-methoxy-6-polyprenyl-1,4-benzoquinol methylase
MIRTSSAAPHAEGLPVGAEKRRAVRAMFDRIAPRYDALNRLFTLGLDQRWRRLALDSIGVGAGDLVVDLATGTGDLAELACARGARVIGVDSARGMLRGAQRRGMRAALVQGEVERVPLPDAAASAVVCGFSLRNFVALDRVLAEMARLLSSGGRLALLDVDVPRSRIVRFGHSLYFERVVPKLGALLSDRAAYRYLPRSVSYLPPRDDLLAEVRKAGFEEVEHRTLLFGTAQLITARRTST